MLNPLMLSQLMMALIPALLSLAAFGAPAQAQEPTGQSQPAPAASAAEQLFRDAWWAESGKNDLATALRGYLAAAAADGPAGVRARALLHAAGSQQRLGKADAALDLYRKILAEYATERAIVEQARVHLRELTAVDLRQNYDEWYERRLFGEEIQLLILGKLEALTTLLASRPSVDKEVEAWGRNTRSLEAEILAFGKGAVPALRKACAGGHAESREHAIDMLLRLGELPSAAALLSSEGWLGDSRNWAALLQKSASIEVPASAAWHRPLVAAAFAGPNALLEQLLASRDANLIDRPHIVMEITLALLQHGQSVDATLAAIQAPATPTRLRPYMERALIDPVEGAVRLLARQWMALSEDPLHFELRYLGTRRAANLVGKGDDALLEALLQRAETSADAMNVFTRAIAEGLGRLVAPLDVPWTAARLRRLILLGRRNFEGSLVEVTGPFHLHGPARQMLAEALLDEPAAFAAAIAAVPQDQRHEEAFSDQVARPTGEERETVLFCTRWNAAMLAVLERDWSKWDDSNRAAAVGIVEQALRSEVPVGAMRKFFEDKKAGAAQPVRDAIDALFAKLPG